MHLKLFLLCLILSSTAQSQQLNSSGHFLDGSTDPFAGYKPAAFFMSGDSRFLETKYGYVVLPMSCESSPVEFQLMNSKGKEVFAESFTQVINLSFSPDRSFCVFHNTKKIIKINLSNYKKEELQGSSVFSINNSGDLSYFNAGENVVYLNDKSFPVSENILRIQFSGKNVLLMSKHTLFCIKNGTLDKICSEEDGSFFDWTFSGSDVYISTKISKKDEFIFRSYRLNEKSISGPIEEKHLQRTGEKNLLKERKNSIGNVPSSTGDFFRDPIDFFSDTVYQPVGNSYAEIQYYGSPRYLHPGVDLLGTHLQDVHSVKKGFVKAILTTADTFHWRIAISTNNTSGPSEGYLYAHLDMNTIPFQVGDSVQEGDVVGQLVDFPVQGFVHCHFARIVDSGAVWNGSWWTYQNPLSYMSNFFDTVAPVFEKTIHNDVFAFRDAAGLYLSPDSLQGQVKVISKFYDLINSIWHVDVDNVRYNLSPLASPQTLLLDTVSYRYDFYTDVYSAGPYNGGVLRTIYSLDSVCYSTGDYQFRDFYHLITNSDGNDTITSADSAQYFNTVNYQDGSYIIRVFATDPSGNTSMDSMIIRIRNSNVGINSPAPDNFLLYPNPSQDGNFKLHFAENNPITIELFNSLGQRLDEKYYSINRLQSSIYINEKGIYFLHATVGKQEFVRKIVRL